MDVLPAEFKRGNDGYLKRKVTKIVDIILNTIHEGLLRDGRVTIEGFGRFYIGGNRRVKWVKFEPCKGLKREVKHAQPQP